MHHTIHTVLSATLHAACTRAGRTPGFSGKRPLTCVLTALPTRMPRDWAHRLARRLPTPATSLQHEVEWSCPPINGGCPSIGRGKPPHALSSSPSLARPHGRTRRSKARQQLRTSMAIV